MRGLRQIVRFNWPFYAAASIGVAAGRAAVVSLPALPTAARAVMLAAIAIAAYWIVASLVSSWLIYDLSELTRWTWVRRALGVRPPKWINIHAGLDESTPALRALFGSDGRVFDIFDPAVMTEPSIARARRLARNAVAPEPIDFRDLPVASATTDAACVLLSAHELRRADDRQALFGELSRVLAADGKVIVAEHLRDWPNFLAFGPGFLHFHSRRAWRRCFERAQLVIQQELSITPFIHVFILGRSS